MNTENEILRKQIRDLEDQLELSKADKSEYSLSDSNPLSKIIYSILNRFDNLSSIEKIYAKFWNVFNYMLICGIGGTLVNYVVLSFLISLLPLVIADIFAIGTAALWNYTFTVGPMGYLSGLSIKKPDKFKKAKEWS
jgi:hypothetical protein